MMHILIALLLFQGSTGMGGFCARKLCPALSERISHKCSRSVSDARGLTECVYMCSLDTSCTGASIEASGVCYNHHQCPDNIIETTCNAGDNSHMYMSKNCDKMESKISESEPVFGTCGDLYRANYPDGVFTVLINLGQPDIQPFYLICKVYRQKTRSYVFSSTGMKTMNKTLDDYVKGFRAGDDLFWSGLEAWHRFSQAGFKTINVRAIFHDDRYYAHLQWTYTGFIVRNKRQGYSFSFDKEIKVKSPKYNNKKIGSCLSAVEHQPFSAWDNDNDDNANKNCAAQAGSGWWYKTCDNPCNVFGFNFDQVNVPKGRERFSLPNVDVTGMMPVFWKVVIFVETPN